MSRLTSIAPEQATGKTADLFGAIQGKLGMVPNLMRTIGQSPAALEAYLQFSGSLAKGVLSNKERELIALAVGQANQCDYCLAAHSALGQLAGLTSEQMLDARQSSSVDSKTDAFLKFAKKLVDDRGRVSDADVQQLKDQGYGEAAISEIIGNVGLNIFTNYFNHVAETEIDFPAAPQLAASCSCH